MATTDARAANEAVVRRIFDAFARKQGFALRDLFSADAAWTVPGDGAMAGVYRGREEIFRFLARLPKETGGTYESRLVDVHGPKFALRELDLMSDNDDTFVQHNRALFQAIAAETMKAVKDIVGFVRR